MSAQGIPLKSDFRERARVNDDPSRVSLDLRQRRSLMGALRSYWQPDRSMQIPGNSARRNPLRYCRCGNGDGVCKHPCPGRILHYRRTSN